MTPQRILFLLLAIGLLIRSVGLATVPPALNSDELLKSFDGASVYRTGMDHHGHAWPLFFQQSGEYSPPLYIYFAGLFSAPLGIHPYTVRLPSAILGTLSILCTFLFVKHFSHPNTALLAAALVTFSPWNVHYSRIGWEAISLIPLQLASLWMFWVWKQNGRACSLILSSALFALTTYAYPTARLSSLMLMAGLVILHGNLLWNRKKQAFLALGTFILLLLPYLVALAKNYDAMQARWNFVTVFQREDGWMLFVKQYFQHLDPDFLFFRGNPQSLHALAGGLALLALFPFFLAGFIRILQRRNQGDWILLVWFFTFAIPASMTYDRYDPASMPNALRAINGMPLLEIISALGLSWLFDFVKQKGGASMTRKVRLMTLGLIAVNGLYIGYDTVAYYPQRSAQVWQYGLREAVQYIEKHKADYDHVVVSHKVRLHPVALAVFAGRKAQPFNGNDFPKYILPFYHYVPMYRDFRMKVYQQYGLITRWYTLAPGKNLLLALAGEIPGEKPLKQIHYPDGTIAYEIFETRRK